MRSKLTLWIVLFALTLGLVFLTPRLGVSQNIPTFRNSPNLIVQNTSPVQPAMDQNMPGMNMSGTDEANFKSSTLIDTVFIVWFSLTALSAIYVAWDAFTSNPELTVMKWGWLLVTLYTGPIGAALYILSYKEPEPMQHEKFIKPVWKQTLGSTIHCLAGDATGIIVAAAITMTLGLPMWLDVISEYIFGFAFGLFVFQSLFMKDMLGGSYLKAVQRSFMPEWLSMNAVMAGMIPVMVILMSRDMTAMEATSIRFWGVMSLATLVGFIVAFPVNMWLVAVGLKYNMVRKSKVTRSQLLAVTLLTLLALAFGVLIAALYGNFTMSARNMQHGSMPGMNMSNQSTPGMNMGGTKSPAPVSSLPPAPISSVTQTNGLVMPPGMIMTSDMSMEAMEDMAAVDLTKITYTASVDARGDQVLQPKLENGVKVFNLDVSLIKWNILPNVQVAAYAFNRQVPGPRIQVTEGDRVRMVVKNNLPEPTTVHWHGMILPNNMDGPADVTQKPIQPGASYTYEFTVKQPGTYFYHSHKDIDRQQTLGMYGAFIVDPKNKPQTLAYNQDVVVQLQEWTVKQGYTFPAMPMEGLLPNFFTINGKAYPATTTINAKVGEKIRFRFIGSNNAFIHPMHIHGGPFKIIETDGSPVPVAAQIEKDTINVAPGERYDVIWTAREKGKWLLHCHIAHHATNNNVEVQGAGGLTMIINVT